MSSRSILYILYALFTLFILNILGYYGSSAYREFLLTLKYGDEVKITDELILTKQEELTYSQTGSQKEGPDKANKSLTNTGTTKQVEVLKKALILSSDEEKVVDAFKKYSLKKLLVHPSLFDLTTEYPDDYFEYYSEALTLYVFSTKNYQEVTQVFEAMATELPFMVNRANPIGTSSFFINVKPEFQDGYVRIVFEYNQKVFGLKIRKDMYNEAKSIIKNIP